MTKRWAWLAVAIHASVILLACNSGKKGEELSLAAQGTPCIVWTCPNEWGEADSIVSLDTCPSDGSDEYYYSCENYFDPDQCATGYCDCSLSDEVTCDGTTCTFLPIDSQNCGACGHSCEAGFNCRNGACMCLNTLCGTNCFDLQTDELNCGRCGNICGANFQCDGGQCCPNDKPNLCNDVCVNLLTDMANCGSCGKKCDYQSNQCSQGSCICNNNSLTTCATNCDTEEDTCLIACGYESCANEEQQEQCRAARVRCDNGCTCK